MYINSCVKCFFDINKIESSNPYQCSNDSRYNSIELDDTVGLKSEEKPTQLNLIKYSRNFSSLVSRATFAWLFPLLRTGYKRPLELSDLGQLPQVLIARWINCNHELSWCPTLGGDSGVPVHSTDCIPGRQKGKNWFINLFRNQRSDEWKSLLRWDDLNPDLRLMWESVPTLVSNQIHVQHCTPAKLWLCYWKTYWTSLAVGALIKVLADVFGLVGPLSIESILIYVNHTQHGSNGSNGGQRVNTAFYCLTWSQMVSNGYVIALMVLLATLLQSTFSNNFNHLVIAEGIHLKSALNVCLTYSTVQSV